MRLSFPLIVLLLLTGCVNGGPASTPATGSDSRLTPTARSGAPAAGTAVPDTYPSPPAAAQATPLRPTRSPASDGGVAAGDAAPTPLLSVTRTEATPTPLSPPETSGRLAPLFLPLTTSPLPPGTLSQYDYAQFLTDVGVSSLSGLVGGTLRTGWPLTVAFAGPAHAETDDEPNPFLDYRLEVTFVGPSRQVYRVPGFFAGDGQGGSRGNQWHAHFAADEAGDWFYRASFRQGPEVAVDLDPAAGEPVAFDGAAGSFAVDQSDETDPPFFYWGRLQYAGSHYLKFSNGPFWIKGGTNSPENFLGYAGFDNTVDQGGIIPDFLHHYAPHIANWRQGEPLFTGDRGVDSRGIIGALNYLHERHVNSIYFLPLNLGGDGQETYPFISPGGTWYDNTHYDLSKLHQWGIVLEHAQRREVALHIVLNEYEEPNRRWLDDGRFGPQRRLFYRELIARFGHLPAIKWNISEENAFYTADTIAFADYISALDWAGHPLAVHSPYNDFRLYEPLLGHPAFDATSIQYGPDDAGAIVETWRARSAAAGRPWVLDMDENGPAATGLTDANRDDLRQRVLYDVYFSGGNIEWYAGYHALPLGGDMRLEDFRTREAMWDDMWHARRFLIAYLPFWAMEPADQLLSGESDAYGGGEVFALPGVAYAVYLPDASQPATLAAEGEYILRWYDPRLGRFQGEARTVTATGTLSLGSPPVRPADDWVFLATAPDYGNRLEAAPPYP